MTERLPESNPRKRHRSSADYIDRTIETVRNHRDADNCWPQWANIFADEIEDLRADCDTLRDRLVRVEAIATRGAGPDTTPEVALATIAHFVSLTLARVTE